MIASLLAALLVSSSSSSPVEDGWTALPLPALCAPAAEGLSGEALPPGSHVDLGDLVPVGSDGSGHAAFPVARLIELLEADARREGFDLRLVRTAPPLLARGSSAGLDRARSLVAELDRAGRAAALEVELMLEPLGDGAPEAAVGRSARLRSGERLTLGRRIATSFLGDYEVDVASGGGTADPVTARAWTGHVAELRAWRTPTGSGAFVAGELDLSELLGLSSFETEAPDLGAIELPRIGTCRVRFSGRVPTDGALTVEVRGAPLSWPDWRLTVRVETPPLPAGDWRVVDLALLESAFVAPRLPEPGAGLARAPRTGGSEDLEPLSSAILWGELEASFAGRRADRPLFALAPGWLVAPASEERVWTELDRLLAAAEASRVTTRAVSVRAGDLTVRVPAAEGVHVLVQAGVETTALVDFDVQLAPEFWMADPVVERVFDGVALRALLSGGRLGVTWWRAESSPSRELDRDARLHGRVSLPARSFRSGTLAAEPGQEARAEPDLSVALEAR